MLWNTKKSDTEISSLVVLRSGLYVIYRYNRMSKEPYVMRRFRTWIKVCGRGSGTLSAMGMAMGIEDRPAVVDSVI